MYSSLSVPLWLPTFVLTSRLASGVLLVSCFLFSNWLPLLVVATYVLDPLPNAICAPYGAGEYSSPDSSGVPYPLFGWGAGLG